MIYAAISVVFVECVLLSYVSVDSVGLIGFCEYVF